VQAREKNSHRTFPRQCSLLDRRKIRSKNRHR
jgi:hypothetical protein